MAYEYLEHTADLKIKATGKTLEEALSESARAVFEAIAGKSRIEPKLEREMTIIVREPETLVHDFLGRLIYLFSTEHILFSEFNLVLKEAIGYKLIVKARGEPYDPKKHKLIKEVKAVTYHDMRILQVEDGTWKIEVVCDT
ncbi:MAG: archease [Candidatus Altiarchaeota archaeon]